MTAPPRRLLTIPISHYCEKARWALERAGLPYHEERHVQGVHRVMARRAGGGNTVPVLVTGDEVLGESEEIIAYADRELAEADRLLPSDPVLRDEVLATSRWLDAGLGPEGRRLMYAHMLEYRRLMLQVNCQGVPAWERRLLTATWPVAIRAGKRVLSVGPDAKQVAERHVWEAFDAVAERLEAGGGYLCGGRFTGADLTFAALAASVVIPPQYGVVLPQPDVLPEPTATIIRQLRAHPAGRRALELFAQRRRAGLDSTPATG
jgi:glutathione S-transferase